MMAAAPLILRASSGLAGHEDMRNDEALALFLTCVIPVVRLLKLLRHFETFRLLLNAFLLAFEALPMILYIAMVMNLIFAAMIYAVEPRSNVESPYHAMYFCAVTMTTVGYGDITPTTVPGYMITWALIVCSVLFTAVPIGIIGSTFQGVWEIRDRVLLIARTRAALRKWGYTVHDIPELFRSINPEGELEMYEFTELLKEMQIGLSENRIIQLFHYLDNDGSGALDHEEFSKVIFPNNVWRMGATDDDEPSGTRSPDRRGSDRTDAVVSADRLEQEFTVGQI
jgi:hypothetical protein